MLNTVTSNDEKSATTSLEERNAFVHTDKPSSDCTIPLLLQADEVNKRYGTVSVLNLII